MPVSSSLTTSKTEAPFWKKRNHRRQKGKWVDARESDDEAIKQVESLNRRLQYYHLLRLGIRG